MAVTAYTLIRSQRKTLAIHIKPDGTVEVRAPLRLAKREIERFILEKTQWIERKQEQIATRPPAQPRERLTPVYADGDFEKAIRELVAHWERRLGVSVEYVGIRAMSSRWGSCTAKTRRIRLNAALAYCPPSCLEYVIVHELAHMRESNHSSRFWEIVADALPDYKERRKKLKTFSWLINIER
jgi:predicted metal-dependent hydrolase